MKYVIFGAGNFGQIAAKEYGLDNVAFFVDNSPEKQGKTLLEKEILSFDEYKKEACNYLTIIALKDFDCVTKQCRENNICSYEIFLPMRKNIKSELEKYDIESTNFVLVGICNRSEWIYQQLKKNGVKSEQISAYSKFIDKSVLKNEYNNLKISNVSKGDVLVVADMVMAYSLQEYIERKFPDYTILNMFTDEMYGDSTKLVVNPNDTNIEIKEEAEWISRQRSEESKQAIKAYMEILNENIKLFKYIEIETINRCNGVCSFCPVSYGNDIREKKIMDESLFFDIIDQLAELNYSGKLAVFSNNEPFLDSRIIQFNKYAREKLPNARLHLFTNGTLVKLEAFIEIVKYLDELIIDNYSKNLCLLPSVKKIKTYCEQNPELIKKVTILTRKPDEILTTRGGDAPNREKTDYMEEYGCVLPFKQMTIRPDGKVSLCCNDAYGKYTLGDTTKERLVDIWFGDRFSYVRKCMLDGRSNFGECKYCDYALLS